jgi:hypothetical protein
MKLVSILSTFFIILLLFNNKQYAQEIRTDSGNEVNSTFAKKIATNFLVRQTDQQLKDFNDNYQLSDLYTMVHYIKNKNNLIGDSLSLYYVFSLKPKGFIIVAANKKLNPILGYSLKNNYWYENEDFIQKEWSKKFNKNIYKTLMTAKQDGAINRKWANLSDGISIKNGTLSIQPLVKTQWGQNGYYNDLCPYDSVLERRTVTGCTTTAVAQIIKYHSHPDIGYGKKTKNYKERIGGNITVDYGNTQYDWSSMPDKVESFNFDVAQLMFHVGHALDVGFETNSSGGYENSFSWKFFFGYEFDTKNVNNEFDKFNNIFIRNLQDSLPVLIGGSISEVTEHVFVCDGIDENGLYHINFGYYGNRDGFYSLEEQNINVITYNIKPKKTISFFNHKNSLVPARRTIAADINNDGILEIINYCSDNNNDSINLYTNKQGTFEYLKKIELGHYNYINNLIPTDLNNDNFIDFLIPYNCDENIGGQALDLWVNEKENNFSKKNVIPHDIGGIGQIISFDFDNDGDNDIFTKNYLIENILDSLIIHQDYFNSLVIKGISDIDNDGDMDIIALKYKRFNFTGQDNHEYFLLINKNGKFKEFNINVTPPPRLSQSYLVVEDFNDDGYDDLCLRTIFSNDSSIIEVYENKSYTFEKVFSICSEGVSTFSNITVADFNNDGLSDILYSINNDSWSLDGNYYSGILINNGNFNFLKRDEDVAFLFSNGWYSNISVNDLNGDNRIDLLRDTWTDCFYMNNTAKANTIPTPPSISNVIISNDSIQISWTKGYDTETDQNSLTYNLAVGNDTTDCSSVMSPSAVIPTGELKVTKRGNVLHNTEWKLSRNNIVPGKYYARVQTIDNGYSSSLFSAPFEFYVTPTTIFNYPEHLCLNAHGTIEYIGNASNSAIFNWQFDNGEVISGEKNGPFTVKWQSPGIKNVHLQIIDGELTVVDSFKIEVSATPEIHLGVDSTITTNDSIILDAGENYQNYLWSDGSTGQKLILNGSIGIGYYTIWIEAEYYGCIITDTINVHITKPVNSMNINKNDELIIFPNPINQNLNIEFTTIPRKYTIEFYNDLGQLVIQKQSVNKLEKLNLEEFTSGIYYLKVFNEEFYKTKKIIVN